MAGLMSGASSSSSRCNVLHLLSEESRAISKSRSLYKFVPLLFIPWLHLPTATNHSKVSLYNLAMANRWLTDTEFKMHWFSFRILCWFGTFKQHCIQLLHVRYPILPGDSHTEMSKQARLCVCSKNTPCSWLVITRMTRPNPRMKMQQCRWQLQAAAPGSNYSSFTSHVTANTSVVRQTSGSDGEITTAQYSASVQWATQCCMRAPDESVQFTPVTLQPSALHHPLRHCCLWIAYVLTLWGCSVTAESTRQEPSCWLLLVGTAATGRVMTPWTHLRLVCA